MYNYSHASPVTLHTFPLVHTRLHGGGLEIICVLAVGANVLLACCCSNYIIEDVIVKLERGNRIH